MPQSKDPQRYTPVQNFIERMQSRKSEKASLEVQGAYTLMILAASRHQTTYGEAEMPEAKDYQRELEQLLGEAPMIQNLIDKLNTILNSLGNQGTRVVYQSIVDAVERHYATYGEDRIEELIHYLDEISLIPGLSPYAAGGFKHYADKLQNSIAVQ